MLTHIYIYTVRYVYVYVYVYVYMYMYICIYVWQWPSDDDLKNDLFDIFVFLFPVELKPPSREILRWLLGWEASVETLPGGLTA